MILCVALQLGMLRTHCICVHWVAMSDCQRASGHCFAGQTYTSCNGEGGNQGMLRTCLLDNASGTLLYVANTHLKAKAGSKNDAIQDHQVRKNVCMHSNYCFVHSL